MDRTFSRPLCSNARFCQHPRQWGHPAGHAARFPSCLVVLQSTTKHFVLAALRRGRLPQLQELHPDPGGHDAGPLFLRRWIRRRGHEQSMAAPVFDGMGISRSHGPVREEPGVDNPVASLARTATTIAVRLLKRPTSCTPLATCSRNRSSRSPLPKTLWNGPWQKRRTMRTTRLCQTRRLIPTWSGASHCAWYTALDRVKFPKIATSIISQRLSLLSHVSGDQRPI